MSSTLSIPQGPGRASTPGYDSRRASTPGYDSIGSVERLVPNRGGSPDSIVPAGPSQPTDRRQSTTADTAAVANRVLPFAVGSDTPHTGQSLARASTSQKTIGADNDKTKEMGASNEAKQEHAADQGRACSDRATAIVAVAAPVLRRDDTVSLMSAEGDSEALLVTRDPYASQALLVPSSQQPASDGCCGCVVA